MWIELLQSVTRHNPLGIHLFKVNNGNTRACVESRIANSVLNKGKSAIPALFNGPEMLPSASDKAELFAKNFYKNSNLDDSVISLLVFPSRTNLKLRNISVTSKMVKKVKRNLDSSKASGPDIIIVVELLWAWIFIHTSWTLRYVSKEVLFSRLLKGFFIGPCI